jgi:hypothetical protein
MGACSSATNYTSSQFSISLAQLHHIKLWGLNFFIYILPRKLLYRHNTIIANIVKTTPFRSSLLSIL